MQGQAPNIKATAMEFMFPTSHLARLSRLLTAHFRISLKVLLRAQGTAVLFRINTETTGILQP